MRTELPPAVTICADLPKAQPRSVLFISARPDNPRVVPLRYCSEQAHAFVFQHQSLFTFSPFFFPCPNLTAQLFVRVVVMVGDPAQLPATIFSREADGANFGQSLFLRLQRGGHAKLMLDTQYRMHPSIASFASSRFYHGLLRYSTVCAWESPRFFRQATH